MVNKDIEQRLLDLYIKGWITKEELMSKLEALDKKDKPDIPEPPTVY